VDRAGDIRQLQTEGARKVERLSEFFGMGFQIGWESGQNLVTMTVTMVIAVLGEGLWNRLRGVCEELGCS
jgi:hypothetical protein